VTALDGSCSQSGTLEGCCAAIDDVGEACLEEVANAITDQPDMRQKL
jgi:hypothetical protein